ncbi:MAG TPA: fibrillarin-like rRNA/tRNA 2'-O-methyltransferase [Candidatus Norongarragalinales archaeon]|jgi:fibrillarin-like pre-rRNA processing protein|nr:fibrillarin-like rRNA/tRNA 2'-O-methyltransferase [Candidatus Norongarragalinales archaeon]
MSISQRFPGVWKIDNKLATQSLAPGTKVYGEDLVKSGGHEYRIWDPWRSKLAAAIVNGLRELSIKPGMSVLYLGAASGTTPSHVSDIVGRKGSVYCVEKSAISMRELIGVCETRPNMLPIHADARALENYEKDISGMDVVYQDVADQQQARILLDNSKAFLKPGGSAIIAIKARSVSATQNPEKVFADVRKELGDWFEIVQQVNLRPFDKDHLLLNLRSKK